MALCREKIAEYIAAGATYDEIAEILDVPKPLILRECMLMSREIVEEAGGIADHWRGIALERYEMMLEKIEEGIDAGVRPDISLALKIVGEERALLGIDQPRVQETKVTGTLAVGVRDLDRYAPEALARVEAVLAKVLESGGEEIEEAEILALIEAGAPR